MNPSTHASIPPLLDPSLFVGLDDLTHLCTGGEAPWLAEFDALCADYGRCKSAGLDGRAEIYRRGEACRQRLGRLWDVPARQVGFLPSAAAGMGWLAQGLDWRPGDVVVTDDLEFPSVAYAWRQLQAAGVEVRWVPHRDYRVYEQDLLEAVDGRTRVLAVSQVSFYTGQNLDIDALAAGLRARAPEALLAVDATHAAGVVPVPAGCTDLCVSSSYKWLLATHGTAPCYVSERAAATVADTTFGWRNLQVWPPQGAVRAPAVDMKDLPERLEPGNPAMLVVWLLDRGVERLLDLGLDAVQAHARALAGRLTAGLEARGRRVISPPETAARSGNTCFLHEDAADLTRRLAERGVLVWGEYGRVRVSGHVHNGSDDVDRFLEVLDEID